MNSFKTWKSLLTSNKTSILLAILALVLLGNLIYFSSKAIQKTTEVIREVEEVKNTLQESLLPENYVSPTPATSSSLQSTDYSDQLKTTPKPTLKSSTPSNGATPEKVAETVEGRDLDREIIAEQIADFISEYHFNYGKYPEFYGNKSEEKLLIKESSSIYFYNGKENKTNAMGISLPPESYLFREVLVCEGNYSTENSMNFTFDKGQLKISLCTEGNFRKEFAIL